jgi:Actin like proteins N terminal domain
MYLEIYSTDIGNRFIKTDDLNGRVAKRPAHIKFIDNDTQVVGTEESPIVTVIEGINKIIYVVGKKAQRQGGQSNLHAQDKMTQFKYFLLATLPSHPLLEINKLLIAVPDSRFKEHQAALQEIIGTHQYVRNGKQQVVKIRNIQLVDEAKGAYFYGVNQGLFGLPHELNAVWSAGGGDFCASLLLDGEIVEGSRLVIKKGTLALANAIASKKKAQLSTNLDPIEIMDSIENGTYTTYKGGDFSDIFQKCLSEWIKEITGEIGINWKEYLPNIRQILIVGGSAQLFHTYREGLKNKAKCIICDQAQDAIVLGLKYA